MEALVALFDNKENIATKNISNMDKIVNSALSENPDAAMQVLVQYFFSPVSGSALQTFVMHTGTTINKIGQMENFEAMTREMLAISFWQAENPNFEAAVNAVTMYGGKYFFGESQEKIIGLVCSRVIPEDAALAASKIIDAFLNEFQEPVPMELPDGFTDVFAPYAGQTTSFSILASVMLKLVCVKGFDNCFALLRGLAKTLSVIIPKDITASLFNEESHELKTLVKRYMNETLYILFLSVFSRIYKEAALADYCFEKLKVLLADTSSPVDRVFGYNSVSQIAVSVSSLGEFSDFFMSWLMRDFDSSNNLITSALKTVFKAILKQAKSTSVIQEVAELMMHRVELLSWHSKVKSWIVPQLLPFIDISKFLEMIFDQLVQFAQDPTDSGFVSKCVKSFARSKDVCEALINACNESCNGIPVDGQLVILRPILKPIFENQPSLIGPAFMKLTNPVKYINTWLRLECLWSSPRSKWPITPKEVADEIRYAWKHGNWDLKAASLSVLALSGIPSEKEEFEWFCAEFENLFCIDSPKHMATIIAAFADFVFRMKERTKDTDEINKLMQTIISTAANHIVPSYMSDHRGFVLEIASNIIYTFGWERPELNKFLAFASAMWDSNNQVASSAAKLIKFIFDQNPDQVLIRDARVIEKLKKFEPTVAAVESEESADVCGLLDACRAEEDWDKQCEMFQVLVDSVDKNNQKQIEDAARCLFEIIFTTRKLITTCQGQAALETITKNLQEPRLSEVVGEWTERILATLDGFDMENMRRSAALPYLAQSILRLQPPELMKSEHSIFDKLVKALVSNIETTTSSSEATHSLNVIRAVLTDKITSPMAEAFLPSVFIAVIRSCGRFCDWDSTAAANLCMAAVVRKVFKKNYSQESEQSLSLNQFFTKMPGAREELMSGLRAERHHLRYMILMIISTFDCVESDPELLELIWPHIGSKDSRLRREAARAVVSVTAAVDRHIIFGKTLECMASSQGFNMLHGCFMVLKQLLLVGPTPDMAFPSVNVLSLPPFMWNDACFVLSRFGKTECIPDGAIDISDFHFDEVAAFLHRKAISQDLSVPALVSLLLRMTKDCPEDLAEMLNQKLITPDMGSSNLALLNTGLDFLHDHEVVIDSGLLVHLIKQGFPPHIVANLIHFIPLSNPTSEQIKELLPLLQPLVYNLGEDMTPVHIAVAECLPLLLTEISAYTLALRLIIDDVPKVRTLTMKAVSSALGVDFLNEVSLFRVIKKHLAEHDQRLLMTVAVKWLTLLNERTQTDTHGEALTILVDEFFVVREIFATNSIQLNYWPYPLANLVDVRPDFIRKATECIEEI